MNTTPIFSRRFLYLTVFVSGMTTLAVELSASRLLGSVFGTSNIVWANVIGLILLYLTVGYFVGGRWADRSPHPTTLYRILLWASFLSALIPIAARPVLRAAALAVTEAQAGVAIGSFGVIVLLFAAPITLLGTVSPFAIRLAVTRAEDAGRISGAIYAVSTLGSLLGTFLPTLYTVPEWGTTATFAAFSAVLYVVALIGLGRAQGWSALRWAWMPVVVAVLMALSSGPLRAAPEGQTLLEDRESAYNYIQVLENPSGYRLLALNEGQGVHSIYHPTEFRYGGTWDYFLTAPYFNANMTPDQVESLLVVGLAAGTIPRQYQHVYGDIPMVGLEIDPAIITIGQRWFGMSEAEMPSLQALAEDARLGMNQRSERFDVIAADAYRPPYIPWHLTTVEFFTEVRAHLSETGVLAINVGRTPTDRRLVDALTNVLLQVFPSVYALDVPRSFNTILYATVQPTEATNLLDNLAVLPADASPLLRDVLTASTAALVETNPSDLLFTDDRASVETLVDSLVFNFLTSGNLETLR
jgi:spermidine synthase